jgi:hypothetical protein
MDEQRGSSDGLSADEADGGVHVLFDRLGRALGAADGAAIARMWDVPALVVADQGMHAVTALGEIEQFFSLAAAQYQSRGIRGTRAEIVRLDWATDRLAIVRVRWPFLDGGGQEIGEETTTYTLRRNEDGDLRICVAILHGEPAKH